MRKLYLILLLPVLISACAQGLDIPQAEESVAKSKELNEKYNLISKTLDNVVKSSKQTQDVKLTIRATAMNKVLDKIANETTTDITLNFQKTPEIFVEEKSTLGIKYKNYVNLESGNMEMDLKKVRINKSEKNKLEGLIELEGKGKVSVAGKYMGVPASMSPELQLYLYETFNFETKLINGTVNLVPEKKTAVLKTKTSLKLLEWSIPYYKEVPLEITELIKPIALPLVSEGEIQFPMPAKTFGSSKVEMIPLKLELKNTKLDFLENSIEVRTDMNLIKKQ